MEPDSGTIRIGDQVISDVTLSSLRKNISIIPQVGFVFWKENFKSIGIFCEFTCMKADKFSQKMLPE